MTKDVDSVEDAPVGCIGAQSRTLRVGGFMGKNTAIGIVIFALVLSATAVGVSTFLSAKDMAKAQAQIAMKVDKTTGEVKSAADAASASAVQASVDASQNLLPKVNGTATDLRANSSLWAAGRFLVTPSGDTSSVVFNVDADSLKPSVNIAAPLTVTKKLTAGDFDSKGTTVAKTFKTTSGSFEVGDNGNAALKGDLSVGGKSTVGELVVTGQNLTIGKLVSFGTTADKGYGLYVDGVIEGTSFSSPNGDQAVFVDGIAVVGEKTAMLSGRVESGTGSWFITSVGDGTFNSLTTNTLTANGATLLKSGATVSGGKLTAEDGLTVTGGSTVAGGSTTSGGATVNGTFKANDDAQVGGDLTVNGAVKAADVTATSSLKVGTSAFSVTSAGNVAASGNLTVGGTGSFDGDFAVNTSKFTVDAASGDTTVLGKLSVAGANFNVDNAGALSASAADIAGALNVSGAMDITGAGTVGGLLTASNGLAVSSGSILNGGNTLSGGNTLNGGNALNGGADVNGLLAAKDNFTVAGNSTITGTLSVTGLTQLGDLDVSGDADVTGDVTGKNATFSGSISAANLKSGVVTASGVKTTQAVAGMPAGAIVIVTPMFQPDSVYWVTVDAGSFDLHKPAPDADGDFSWIATW